MSHPTQEPLPHTIGVAAHYPPPLPRGPIPVVVTDIDVSFGQVFGLMLKVTVAAIPTAVLIYGVVWMLARFLSR